MQTYKSLGGKIQTENSSSVPSWLKLRKSWRENVHKTNSELVRKWKGVEKLQHWDGYACFCIPGAANKPCVSPSPDSEVQGGSVLESNSLLRPHRAQLQSWLIGCYVSTLEIRDRSTISNWEDSNEDIGVFNRSKRRLKCCFLPLSKTLLYPRCIKPLNYPIFYADLVMVKNKCKSKRKFG